MQRKHRPNLTDGNTNSGGWLKLQLAIQNPKLRQLIYESCDLAGYLYGRSNMNQDILSTVEVESSEAVEDWKAAYEKLKAENEKLKLEVKNLRKRVKDLTLEGHEGSGDSTVASGEIQTQSQHDDDFASSDEEKERRDSSSSNDATTIGPNGHPLLIDLVVENLAQFLDYSSLKNARLVCTAWSNVLFEHFEKNTKIVAKLDILDRSLSSLESVFSPETPVSRRFKTLEIELPDQLQHFVTRKWLPAYGSSLESLSLGYEIPTFKCRCRCEDCANQLYTTSNHIRLLLVKCCPNLKELRIPGALFNEHYKISKPVYAGDSVARLRRLEIGEGHYRYGFDETESGLVLREILSCVASVQSVRLKSSDSFNGKFRSFLLKYHDKPQMDVFRGIEDLDLLDYYRRVF